MVKYQTMQVVKYMYHLIDSTEATQVSDLMTALRNSRLGFFLSSFLAREGETVAHWILKI